MSNPIIPQNEPMNMTNQNMQDLKPLPAPEDEDADMNEPKIKTLIKKRSFEELRKRSQYESQGFGTSSSIDQCRSDQKSTQRKNLNKIAKSDQQLKSSQRIKEDYSNEVEEQDQPSADRNSGSLHHRSVKSLNKRNNQIKKSTFSAQRKFDEDENIEVESNCNQTKINKQNQMTLITQASQQPELQAQASIAQPSALQKMIGPLTISERHQRILKFIFKKHNKNQAKKFTYECRKSVAEKRLRIKGRFVTKQ